MTLVLTLIGVALLAIAVREIFSTLFHPHGRGVLSEALIRGIAHGVQRAGGHRRPARMLAGPLAFLAVVTSWGLLILAGFSLIFWAFMPDGFIGSTAIGGRPDELLDAVYFSSVNITSLGYGDIVPSADGLRLLSSLETIFGLGLLTASIAWLVSIYGALSAYHSVSHEIESMLRHSDAIEPEHAPALGRIASQLIATRRDLLHFPITYYFRSPDPRYALWETMPRLLEVTERCANADDPRLRLEAGRAQQAAKDLLVSLNEEFFRLPGKPGGSEMLSAYARDHP